MRSTNDFYADRVLNLAHRGASHYAPENTMPAFQLAKTMGADGVELDAQLSKDGEVVIIHDFIVDKTTDGQGLVCQKSLADLQKLDAGRYFAAEFAGTRIPTLAELFTGLGSSLLYNIELKTTATFNNALEVEVIRLIEDHQLQNRVLISSFNPFALWRAYRINPHISRALLWSPGLTFYLRWQLFRSLARPAMFNAHWEAITPTLVKKEQQRGSLVNAWTCNDPAGMRRLIEFGVAAIITDRPDVLKQVLEGEIGD